MNDLFMFAAHNTVVAIVFASFVYGLTHVWRNPPVAHLLWLLVLLRLVAPPVIHLDWPTPGLPRSAHTRGQVIAEASRIGGQTPEISPRLTDSPPARMTAQAAATGMQQNDLAATIGRFWNRVRPILLWFWLAGAALSAGVAATRIVRFERHLRDTLPVSERLQQLALEIAGKLGVQRVPDVRHADWVEIPFLWCAGRRPTIVLPVRLSFEPDDQSSALILAHELAHLRRRDHWVRALELIVAVAHWWNPLVWVIRRQIHQVEDLCCDAWVRWAFPDRTRRYAELVFRTAESLSASQVGARLLPASPFLHSLSLKARIEMILEGRFAPRVPKRSMFVIALLALLVLPSFIRTTTVEARARSDDEAPPVARKPETSTSSEFPFAVRFKQGATRFSNGDKITILEVRGTADTFTPGNLYWVKGTYTLASHDRATLAAYVTAKDAENGKGRSLKVQSTSVARGNGTFTLYFPMSHTGWPHVSLYPADGGESFGGNYFGTGDSVLKRWWGD